MILTAAVVLQLAANCAQPVAPKTILAIATQESGVDTLAIHDNSTGKSYHPSNENEYLSIAQSSLKIGHRLDLGIMQIDTDNFGWLGLTLEGSTDPCKSMAAGAEVLTSLSRYNSGSPTRSLNYAVEVNALEHGASATTSRQPAPLPPPDQKVAEEKPLVFPASGNGQHFLIEGE